MVVSGKKKVKGKKKVTLALLEETDLRPTEIEKMHFLGKLPLVAC